MDVPLPTLMSCLDDWKEALMDNNSVTLLKINPEIIRFLGVRMEIDYDFPCFIVELSTVCRSDA